MINESSVSAIGKVIAPESFAAQLATSMIAFHLAMQNGMLSTPTREAVMKAISEVHIYRDDFEPLALPLAVGLLRMLDGYAADDGASARKFWSDVWASK